MKNLLIITLLALPLLADNLSVKWDQPPGANVISGYHAWGTLDGVSFTNTVQNYTNNWTTFSNLVVGTTYTFAVQAIGTNGLLSNPSESIQAVCCDVPEPPKPPPAPLNLRVIVEQSVSIDGPWTDSITNLVSLLTPTNLTTFIRSRVELEP